MLALVRHSVRQAAERSLLVLFGLVCIIVGLSFLTHAAWVALAVALGAIKAAQILGGIFLVIGGLLVFAGRSHRRRAHVPVRTAAAPEATGLALAEAFIVGLNAAQSRRPKQSTQDNHD